MTRRAFIGGAWLLAMGVVATLAGLHAYNKTSHIFTDWVVFEVGARVLVHFHHSTTDLYSDPRLHLYVDNPDIQVGPPALWFVAAFEWLSVRTIYGLFSVVMAGLSCIGVCATLLTGRRLTSSDWHRGRELLPVVAASLIAVWFLVNESDRWKHLDDVMALSFAAVAAYLIATERPWWLIGVLMGTGIAAKPWALILAPIVLALPRRDIARTVLVLILVAGAWWIPFVVAAPDTIQTLGQFRITPYSGSVLYLIGIHGHVEHWLRPVQFMLGLGVGSYVCLRRPWVAVPLAALATRVLTDPYAYGYYGMGPVLFALLYDATGHGWRRLPTFTAFTVAIEFAVPYWVHNGTAIGITKLTWALAILAAILLSNRSSVEETSSLQEDVPVTEHPRASLA